jgi:tetratricopeptide (TPR) repeat protein
LIDEGLAICSRLADQAAGMTVAELTHLALRNEKAACLLSTGRPREAEELLDASLAKATVPNRKRVDFVAYVSGLAMARYLAGLARAANGRLDDARRQWELGLTLLAARHSHPNYRAAQTLLLRALGRSQEAQEIQRLLSAQGYAEPNFLVWASVARPPR